MKKEKDRFKGIWNQKDSDKRQKVLLRTNEDPPVTIFPEWWGNSDPDNVGGSYTYQKKKFPTFDYKEKEAGKKKGGRGLFQFTGNMLRDYNNYRGGMDDSMEFQIDFVLDMIDQRADKPNLPSFFKLSR